MRDRRARDAATRGRTPGFVNLDRIKQALWDAFSGTAQPTTLDGLRLYLDEIGWQVDTTRSRGLRQAVENVPVTTESAQAAVYAERRAARGLRPRHRAGEHLRLPRRRARARASRRASTASTARRARRRTRSRDALASRQLPDAPSPQWRLRAAVVGAASARAPRWSRGQSAVAAHGRGGCDSPRVPSPGSSHALDAARRCSRRGGGRPATAPRLPCRRSGCTTLRLAAAGRRADARRPAHRRDECGARDDTCAIRRFAAAASLLSRLTANMCSVTMRTDVRVVAHRSHPARRRRRARCSGRCSPVRPARAGRSGSTACRPGDTLWSIAVRTFPGDPREGVWELRERNDLGLGRRSSRARCSSFRRRTAVARASVAQRAR